MGAPPAIFEITFRHNAIQASTPTMISATSIRLDDRHGYG